MFKDGKTRNNFLIEKGICLSKSLKRDTGDQILTYCRSNSGPNGWSRTEKESKVSWQMALLSTRQIIMIWLDGISQLWRGGGLLIVSHLSHCLNIVLLSSLWPGPRFSTATALRVSIIDCIGLAYQTWAVWCCKPLNTSISERKPYISEKQLHLSVKTKSGLDFRWWDNI